MTDIDDLDCDEAAERLAGLCDELGVSIEAVFVPFSQSRNSGEKHMSLNWKITVNRNGRAILEGVDYMQGSGHAPASKASVKALGGERCLMRHNALTEECETGKTRVSPGGKFSSRFVKRPIDPPNVSDVISSLAMDADVIDYGDFEEWADCVGFDSDSRSAESIYKACLRHALQLRSGLGDDALRQLQTLARQM